MQNFHHTTVSNNVSAVLSRFTRTQLQLYLLDSHFFLVSLSFYNKNFYFTANAQTLFSDNEG